MKDVAIICAHNPGKRNLGMYTVDLSARDFMAASSADYDLVKYIGNRSVGSLSYVKVDNFSELNEYKTILFWGDFQQNPIWGESNYAHRVRREKRHMTSEQARMSWWRNCLLEGIDIPEGQQVYSVGTCFLGCRDFFDSERDLQRYRASLSRFHGIIPRDIESCRVLKEDIGLENVIEGGFDCACLRNPVVSGQTGTGDYFAYTMRRTVNDPQLILNIVAEVERKTGLRGVPIRWLRSKHAKYKPGGLHRYFVKCIHTIKGGRFFLTDIYHATINAMTEGVPVVCLGDGTTVFRDTCDDLKKNYLFEMIEAKSDYILVDEKNVDYEQIGTVAARLCQESRDLQRVKVTELSSQYKALLRQLPGLSQLF